MSESSAPPPGPTAPTTLVVDALPSPNGAPGPPLVERRRPSLGRAVGHFFRGLRVAAASPGPWFAMVLVWGWLLPLVAVLPVVLSAEAAVDQPVVTPEQRPADFLGPTPAWLFSEWSRSDPDALPLAGRAFVPLVLVAGWIGLLFAAGWMTLGARGGRGLRAFLRGAAEHVAPFLRTWVLGLPLFAAVTWLFWSTPAAAVAGWFFPDGDPALATSETRALAFELTREVLYVGALLFVEVVLDLARARLVTGGGRSAFLALLRGFGTLLAHPLQIGVLVGVGLALDYLWVLGLGAAATAGFLPLLALGLLLPVGRFAFRVGRWAGLASWTAAREGLHRPPPAPEEPPGPTLAV